MTKKSPIRISEDLKSFYIDTAKKLKGSDRRQFMAQLVQQWGFGGATFAEKELEHRFSNQKAGVICC